MSSMKVGCGLILSDEAKAQFKSHTGKLPTRLNVKMWAVKTLSENLGVEVETNFSDKQKAKMKKEMGKDTRMARVKKDPDGIAKPRTVPTILQSRHSEPARKKFTLRKK